MSPVPLFAAPVSSASLEAGRLSAPAPARLSAAARLCAPARSAAGLAAPKGQEAGRGRKPPLRPRLIGRFRPVAPAVESVRTPCELKGAHPLEWMVSPVGQVHGLEEILRVHTPWKGWSHLSGKSMVWKKWPRVPTPWNGWSHLSGLSMFWKK